MERKAKRRQQPTKQQTLKNEFDPRKKIEAERSSTLANKFLGTNEAERANIIMGDACEAFKELLSEGGEDYSLLDKAEKESGNIDCHTYTQEGKVILRQYEGSEKEAKQVSLFNQIRGSWQPYAYLLLTLKTAIQRSSSDQYKIPEGDINCYCIQLQS